MERLWVGVGLPKVGIKRECLEFGAVDRAESTLQMFFVVEAPNGK